MDESNRTTFNLRALVRSITDGSGLLGPREIAEKVAENVPADELRAALAETLVPYVREDLIQGRRIHLVPQAAAATNSGRSAKVAAIREAWRRTLAGQFHVGDGRWQVLADCSYENVKFLAAERHEQARRTAAVGATFDALAEAMTAHRATRVGDLPEPVLAQILSSEAAA